MTSKIEWTDETWNPITGCTPCSPGCYHCYAKRMANRLRGRYGYPTDDPFRVTFHSDKIDINLFGPGKRVFVCSMGDIFHKDVKPEWIADVWSVINQHPDTTFIILTKRPDLAPKHKTWWLPNIWAGITVCNQQEADEKIPILLQIPAAVRWVSIEPMLGTVDIDRFLPDKPLNMTYLDWVVCGSETGPGARPMELQWARNVLDQCKSAGVPFFIKQIDSAKSPIPDDLMIREYPGVEDRERIQEIERGER